MEFKNAVSEWFKGLQSEIIEQLEAADGGAKFTSDSWQRPGGGGGLTCLIRNGNVFERGGVNFSAVHGESTDFLVKVFNAQKGSNFFATGVSIVIHPENPHVPIIHMNVRYFEMGKKSWFGGGIDLTPHFVDENDAKYFHDELKRMCDRFDAGFYPRFKSAADDYFFIHHRNETRGIGGIFYDQLGSKDQNELKNTFEFVKATGKLFAPIYLELIQRNKSKSFDESQQKWQRLRRGRYVEFNLVYDKGTKFGLETSGRTESILMSMPPVAAWEYDYQPEQGSREAKTISYLRKGIDWTMK